MCGFCNVSVCVCVGFILSECLYVWVFVMCRCVYVWVLLCLVVCMCGCI